MIATASLLSAAGTSLWFLVFGKFPSPMFWLVVLVYISVTRPLWESTLLTYLLCLVISAYTAFPFEELLVYFLLMMLMLVLIRERVFWGGPTFFMLMVAVASVGAPFMFWAVSRGFDKNPVGVPQIFDWLVGALLTCLFSLPLYRLYQWYDKIGAQDAGSEMRVGPR